MHTYIYIYVYIKIYIYIYICIKYIYIYIHIKYLCILLNVIHKRTKKPIFEIFTCQWRVCAFCQQVSSRVSVQALGIWHGADGDQGIFHTEISQKSTFKSHHFL